MRIGIVTDIHDDVDRLAAALDTFRHEGVDAVVSIGDTTDMHGAGKRAWEVTKLLRDAGARCVWGNHDYGLCRALPEELAEWIDTPDPEALAFCATWHPRLVVGGCHFSHVEPWLDTNDPLSLWYFEGFPHTPEQFARTFTAVPEHVSFIGHFHRWLVGTPAGVHPWAGESPLVLDPADRYLIVVAALMDGHFAVYDTATRTLFPRRVA